MNATSFEVSGVPSCHFAFAIQIERRGRAGDVPFFGDIADETLKIGAEGDQASIDHAVELVLAAAVDDVAILGGAALGLPLPPPVEPPSKLSVISVCAAAEPTAETFSSAAIIGAPSPSAAARLPDRGGKSSRSRRLRSACRAEVVRRFMRSSLEIADYPVAPKEPKG